MGAALAAIANVIADALAPFDVRVNETPMTPERVLQWIERAQQGNICSL
jgi:CO/xanthine dehydrogenase Mo-binding subunit